MIQSYPELVPGREVAIVGDLPASYPPDSFDGIQFGRVGRQEDESEPVLVLNEKLLQDSCPVVFGIVQNKIDMASGTADKTRKKIAEGLAIERRGLLSEKSTRFQVQRPEEAHLLPSRGREHARLLPLGCPHSYQAAVSLEMHFVLAPELDIGVVHPLVELFLKDSCWKESASWAWRRGLCRVSPS